MIDGQEGVTWPQWVALAQACEQHGVPGLFRSDHYGSLGHLRPGSGSLDAWGTLTGLAAVTTTLRLGTLVSPVTFRHPSVLAKLVTTADHVSGGRIEVGLGAGWDHSEHDAYGFPFPSARVRAELLREHLEILIRTWADEPSSFAGTHYAVTELDAQPKPVQRPHPNIILGGEGGPRSTALAARYASEYNTGLASLEHVRRTIARIADACHRGGRDLLPVSVETPVILGVDDAHAQRAVGSLTALLAGDLGSPVLASPRASWIVGDVDQAAEQLAVLRDAGVSRVFCQHLQHEDLEGVALLGELAQRVA